LTVRTGQPPVVIDWSDDALDLRIDVDETGMARMTRLLAPLRPQIRPSGSATPSTAYQDPAAAALPLLDIILAGEGRMWSGGRYCESVAGGRFRYTGHHEGATGSSWRELRVDLADPVTGLRAEVFYQILAGQGALRSWVRLANSGSEPVTVESVTSFLCGGLSGGADPESGQRPGIADQLADLDVRWGETDWLAEGRWQRRPLRDALPDLNRPAHSGDPRGRFGLTSLGTWSSGVYLPMGAVTSQRSGHAWAWQIEHNGAWHWQVGECTRRVIEAAGPGSPGGPGMPGGPGGQYAPGGSVTGAYIALLGPADAEHHWRITLDPGEAFTTVPVAVAVSGDGFEGVMARLTACRRALRRPHEDHRRLPVIFNDYMNTLMGNPTTERLLPLIAAAAQAGAEYFCIDSGWYTGIGEGWWDTVGAWKPSPTRFPNGITEVLDHIRAAGMIPGLWLEPEVVGVNSPVAGTLPPEAFFQRDGALVVENGRYHLDLRHRAAVKHLDEVVDFLVDDLGIGYFKLDYNVCVAPGTDTGNLAPGAGLLAANRAHLDWLDGALDRHPGLVIENCSSGGMRTDYALLARLQLQSTSDQQDFLRYPPIAAAAPAAMTPEQAASWAYPQPDFTDDEIAFTLCTAMLGRVHLSGHLDQMSRQQRDLVAAAVRVYKDIRADLALAMPFWPLGLPRWTDSWIALGLRAPGVSYLTVWHRGPLAAASGPPGDRAMTGGTVRPGSTIRPGEPAEAILPVPHLHGQLLRAQTLYPVGVGADVSWDAESGALTVSLPRRPSACVISLVP
jgi:alpha-galactosidase